MREADIPEETNGTVFIPDPSLCSPLKKCSLCANASRQLPGVRIVDVHTIHNPSNDKCPATKSLNSFAKNGEAWKAAGDDHDAHQVASHHSPRGSAQPFEVRPHLKRRQSFALKRP